MSQLEAGPTAGLPCAVNEAAPVLEQLKGAEDTPQGTLQLKLDAAPVADDGCCDTNNRPVSAPAPANSLHSTHTGARPGAAASPGHQPTPEERAAAALLSVPPRSSPKPTPSVAGTALAGALAAVAAVDPLVAKNGSPQQRTNWATWPLGTEHQALLLTKFQVNSGQLSAPAARAAAVLGDVASSSSVSLHSPSLDRSFTADLRRYASQPTQVFLVRLKQFFTAASTRGGDVLALARGPAPGACIAEIWHAEDPRAKDFKAHLKNGRPEGTVVGVAAVSMAVKTAAVRAGPPAPTTDGGEGHQRRTSARLSRPPAPPTASVSWSSNTHTVSEEGGVATGGGGDGGDGASSRLRKRGAPALAELSGPAAGLRENPKRRARTVADEDPENAVVYGEASGSPRKRGAAAARRTVRRGNSAAAAAQFRPPRRAAGDDALRPQPQASDRMLRSATAEQEQRRLRRKGHPERSPEGEPDLEGYAAALMALNT